LKNFLRGVQYNNNEIQPGGRQMYTVKIKKINPKAIIPVYAYEGDVGLDLYSVEEDNLLPNEYKLIKTGLMIELPFNTEAQIRPRSGLALNHGITELNAPGTIDQGYRGEIGVILINHSQEKFRIKENMKIAQMVIKPTYNVKLEEVEIINESDRSIKGFGSSGIYSEEK
jgi:dUTP pyrophosphatase